MQETDFSTFQNYVKEHIKGDEKGEAQIFLDHFFTALGFPEGLKGAGANCEFRIKDDKKNSTKFADLVWKPIVLIEMKKRNSDLSIHYQQAFDYWTRLVPNRPQYVILCNFDEFWIYDLNIQVYEPLEKVKIEELHEKREVFAFMYPKPRNPIFNYNKEEVTEKAAYFVSFIYRSMTNRKIEPAAALKYCMQMVLTMFAEDVELLPNHIFTRLIKDLLKEPGEGPDTVTKSYDLISGLFKAMNTQNTAEGGLYKDVAYFNGGLFDKIYSIELTKHELTLIDQAASYNWRKINPAIFGSLFEFALDTKERHKLGAHYTHEIDIKKIVVPVIVQPWLQKIENAETLLDLYLLLIELSNFKVLDPSCGSGNFLFIAFKEMKLLEKTILLQIREQSTKPADAKKLVKFLTDYKYVTTNQLYGYDVEPFAVELAKVTLVIAKELIWLENREDFDNKDKPLPLDNLEKNIVCTDALIDDHGRQKKWFEVDAIIGNPPFQARSKMLGMFGTEYINKLWNAYPELNKYGDFCTFWFYKAHQTLKNDCFAGLVGTNSIRENNSRENSLDYIVNNGGTIVNAVSTQKWSGSAAVSVSIVNWIKGEYNLPKILFFPDDKNNLVIHEIDEINSSLSIEIDVSKAIRLKCNTTEPKFCFMGQKHGHEGFLLSATQAIELINKEPKNAEVLKPYLNGNELVANLKSQPKRFVIDFSQLSFNEAKEYNDLFKIIDKKVLPDREKFAKKQITDNEELLEINPKLKVNTSYVQYYNSWWQLIGKRKEMLDAFSTINRYIACSRVSKRQIFEFISTDIRPNDALITFAFNDDYSFGILQSKFHWKWWKAKCSTLGEIYRYTINPVWDTFPWPQQPSNKQVETIAQAAKAIRDWRRNTKLTLREMYQLYDMAETGVKYELYNLHKKLDKAVMEAYGFDSKKDILQQLLALNLDLAEKEKNNIIIQKPGIPDSYTNKQNLISTDCVCFDADNYKTTI